MSEVAPAEGSNQSASWNVDTLKRYFDAVILGQTELMTISFAGRDKAVEAAFIAQEKAVSAALVQQEKAVAAALAAAKEAVLKAEVAADKRFEAVNEFRGQLTDQNKTFATRVDFENLKEQLNKLENMQSRGQGTIDGHSSGADTLLRTLPIIVSVLALMFIIFNFIILKK